MRDLHKLGRLDSSELADLFRAVVLLPAVALTLRLKGLRAVRAAICRGESKQVHPRPVERSRQIARMVSIAARRGPIRSRCLARSLTLEWLLKREGIEAELRLGVRKVENRLEAHAWIEHEGRPLMDSPDVGKRFAPFVAPLAGPPS